LKRDRLEILAVKAKPSRIRNGENQQVKVYLISVLHHDTSTGIEMISYAKLEGSEVYDM